jgi:hypothetical protein
VPRPTSVGAGWGFLVVVPPRKGGTTEQRGGQRGTVDQENSIPLRESDSTGKLRKGHGNPLAFIQFEWLKCFSPGRGVPARVRQRTTRKGRKWCLISAERIGPK